MFSSLILSTTLALGQLPPPAQNPPQAQLLPPPGPICGFKITGFVYGSANVNPLNSGTRYNGPLTMTDQEGAYLDQLYLSIDRAMEDTFTVGGGLTFLYGNDYNASQSFGWELKP